MTNEPGFMIGMTFICYFAACGILAPILGYTSWLEKRDCELLNQTECAWQMLPKKNDDAE